MVAQWVVEAKQRLMSFCGFFRIYLYMPGFLNSKTCKLDEPAVVKLSGGVKLFFRMCVESNPITT